MKNNNYRYKIGDIVNNSLKVITQTRDMKTNKKSYIVQSLIYPDSPTYEIMENSLLKGVGCSYVAGKKVYEGNSLYSIKWVRPYLTDSSEAKKISPHSNKKIKVKCPECDIVKHISPNNLIKRGYSCPLCSKYKHYPELVLTSCLKFKNEKFKYQKEFSHLPNRFFDFYLPQYNLVIETHGKQHYEDNKFWDYESTLKSDKEKKEFCLSHNIKYIEIDCRVSDYDFIIENINKSLDIINITDLEKVKLLDILENNKRYPIKEIKAEYKKGYTLSDLSKKYSIPRSTLTNILKRNGVSIKGTGQYLKEGKSNNSKKVICINTGKVFDSIKEAKEWSIGGSKISEACLNKRKTAGKHPVTGEKLKWEYVTGK